MIFGDKTGTDLVALLLLSAPPAEDDPTAPPPRPWAAAMDGSVKKAAPAGLVERERMSSRLPFRACEGVKEDAEAVVVVIADADEMAAVQATLLLMDI